MTRFPILVAAALIAALASPAVPARAASQDVVVATHSGPVRGTAHDGYQSFQGVPYAAPPVGELRWRDPQPVAPWSGVREAAVPGNPCPQGPADHLTGNEDCLYLNVTAPAGAKRRPVVVWLHGGSFDSGAGSDYDPHRMAVTGDVVVVTVNYRLGVFGYFGYPGLPDSGTFGLADQQAALRWVRRNAAAFGGDPRNVTLAGQSAGGMSVCSQLTSPSAAGLFDKALIQSGSCLIDYPKNLFWPGMPAGSPWTSRTATEATGSGFAARVGCGTLECLRHKSTADLSAISTGMFTKPAYDTPLLPIEPGSALREGRFQRVPVLEGGNRDEHRGWAAALNAHEPITPQRYRQLLTDSFGSQADLVAERYPLSDYPSPVLAWAAVATDRIWSCPTLTGDRLLARRTPLYAYEFADRDAPAPLGLPPGFRYGAYHGSELPYLFDVTNWPAKLTPDQQLLSDRMIRSWAAFASTGRPWPRFRDAGAVALRPGGVQSVDLAKEHNCDFWSQLP
ncbi:carboxylesterase family protein [Kitasatospora sp. GP82]|uniref:carboxylesterase/lipase family protein n=1 Tax=Kitasatospora sp. GP82 TaxID=3035089 RepID=UPI0024745F91|nr:carboxylesterase family protein [Kitasatospora sp. GP82]MDH6124588.1 para-nitrobenzyl esterase [Kitasatospora sp. GP82]